MRNALLKLSQGIADKEDTHVSMHEYFRMKYLVRLLKEANIGSIGPITAKQFGMYHKTVWCEDETIVPKFFSMHKESLQSWVMRHYLKAICRSLGALSGVDDNCWFQGLLVTPEEHDTIYRTVKILKDKLGTLGSLHGLRNDLALRHEIESTVAMLQGIVPLQRKHGKSNTSGTTQAHDMRIDSRILDSISFIRDTVNVDRDYDYPLNVADRNDFLKWYGTILDLYLSMVRFSSYDWEDRNKYPTLDAEFEYFIIKDSYYYTRLVEAVRPYTSDSSITPEIAILLYKAPVCLCKEHIRPNRYGGTDIEKYVMMDFYIRKRILNEEARGNSEDPGNVIAEPDAPIKSNY